jgi:undecaprenyl-diphosphatase
MTIWQAIILAIVEGITEFLPISSTGHMIIASSILGIPSDEFTKLFIVNIQFGAILSVVVLYWRRFLTSFDIYFKLLAAFIPTAILGLILDDYVDALLESVQVVAASLFVGGIILVFIDKWLGERSGTIATRTLKSSALIGVFQAISMVPGVSRSAATIIGGQIVGNSRKEAAEFSFLLAVPTMFAASALKLLKNKDLVFQMDWTLIAIGNLVAFLVAILAIKFFIAFLTKYGFRVFGFYRIIVGALILILLQMGYQLSI